MTENTDEAMQNGTTGDARQHLESTATVKQGKDNQGGRVMIKSELIQILTQKQAQLNIRDVDQAVKTILEGLTAALASGRRVELRGFGSFSLHERPERCGRNPMTGEAVHLPVNYVPHFKPGKILRRRVDFNKDSRHTASAAAAPDPAPGKLAAVDGSQ